MTESVIEEKVVTPQVGNEIKVAYTTLKPEQVWKTSGTLYVRKVHERDMFGVEEKKAMKTKIPFLEDNRRPDWLCATTLDKYKNPILLTYKVSENTHHESPLFKAVLAKQTMHHTKTSDDMKRVFDNPQDVLLRSLWAEKSTVCPVFIKLWDAYPDIYEELKKCDGEQINMHYASGKLTIAIPSCQLIRTLDVQTIKN